MKVNSELFYISSDFREHQEELGELAQSIKDNGLISPITTVLDPDGRYDVIAGRRRFRAMTEFLKMKELEENIHFLVRDCKDRLVIQLEENLRRKDFMPVEVARLIKQLHLEKIAEHGSADRGRLSSGWSFENTGALIGRDKGFVSRMLKIADNEELVKNCTSVVEALDTVKKATAKAVLCKVAEERANRMEKSLDYSEVKNYLSDYRNVSALELLQSLDDESVDFVLTDPPYGINLDKNSGQDYHTVYSDNPEEILATVSACVPEYYRVLKPGKFIVLWTSFTLFADLLKAMRKAGFFCSSTPLVWAKMNSTGVTSDPDRVLGSVAEVAIYGWKGSHAELNIKGRQNIFPVPIVRGKRIHVAQKPEALSVELLDIFSSFGDLVLDTFTGSGSTIRACYLKRRRFIGCELDKDNYNESITFTMDWFGDLVKEKAEEG